MPSTSIRPDYTVTFKDVNGTTLYQTGDASKIYLTALDEKTPAVKAIKVNVPARDGALDLTEAVAGRPLYGNRQIDMTLSIVGTNHPDAVDKVRTMRRKLHGVVCKVETPDNILPGTPPTQGWYLGRVSITGVTYPGEAAVVKLTVDAQPWIFYGTGTVALTHSAPTSYGIGPLASADRGRVADAIIEIGQKSGSTWNTTADYTAAGYVPTSVALVLSRTANLLEYGTMAEWYAAKLVSPDSWTAGWRDAARYDEDIDLTTAIVSTTLEDADEAHRFVLLRTGDMPYNIMRTGEQDTYYIHVTYNVTTDGGTKSGKASGIYAFAQEQTALLAPPEIAGYIDTYTTPTYTKIWATGDPTGSLGMDVFKYTPTGNGYAIIGIEARWIEGTVTVRIEKVPTAYATGYSGRTNADNTLVTLTAPEPLYSTSAKRNTIAVTPYGTTETVELRVPTGSDTAASITAETIPAQTVTLDGSTLYVRAYGITNRGWMGLQADTSLYPWTTATFDAGDMPTTITATIGSPTAFEKNGNKVIMAESGQLPYALSGSTATLDYMVMGSNDGSLTYEQGTV